MTTAAIPFPLLIPGSGSTPGSGKLVLVEDKILTADATAVTFSGLAGDTDLLYLLAVNLKVSTGGVTQVFQLRPNGSTTGVTQGWTRTSPSTNSYGGGSGASGAFYSANNAAADSMTALVWIHAARLVNAVARYRHWSGTGAHNDNAGPIGYGAQHWGVWNSADELTSLEFGSTTANAIRNGSRFTLWKVAHS